VYYRSHQIFINSVNVDCVYKKTPGKPLFQAAQAVDTMILLHSLWVFPRSASHAVLFYTTIFFSLFQDGKSFSFMYNFFVVTGHGVTSNTLRDAQKSCIRMISR
ncbi:MAG: hypothetical protein KAY52_04665, partial [Blautia sp.]|nr:hypothetical protein [Blautia sp.]